MRLSSLTVDEQLNGFRGYVPGRSYMPAKPAKYGVKISWLNDAKNGFALDCYIYSGKGETREVGIAETIVMRLTKGYFNTNRDTQVSIWIGTLHHAAWSSSSYKMASQQLAQFLSIVATSHTNSKSQREGPNTIQKLCMSQAIVWWWFLTFRRGINRLSSFLQLTRHQQRVDKKPEMVLDYNSGKGGTDLMDSRIEDFSCKRKTRRYPLIFLFNMLDVSLLNSFLICEMNGYTSSRKTFIKAVADQMAAENMQRRLKSPKVLAQTRSAFAQHGLIDLSSGSHSSTPADPRKCRFLKCGKSTRNKGQTCGTPVCSVHKVSVIQCKSCCSSAWNAVQWWRFFRARNQLIVNILLLDKVFDEVSRVIVWIWSSIQIHS